jgi:hypothetical protein
MSPSEERSARRRDSERHELLEWPSAPDPGYRVRPARISLHLSFDDSEPLEVVRVGVFEIVAARPAAWGALVERAAAAAVAAICPQTGLPLGSGDAQELIGIGRLSLGYRTVGPLQLCARAVAGGAREPLIACRVLHLDRAQAVELHDVLTSLVARGVLRPPATTIARALEWSDGAAVVRQVRALAAYRPQGLLLRANGPPWPLRLDGVDDDPLPLRFALEGPEPEPLFQIALPGYNALFRFAPTRHEVRDGWLRVAMPERIAQERRRWRRRASAPDGLALAFRHPMWPQREQVRRLRDVSTVGLGLWIWPEADLLEPGIELDNVAVLFRGEVVCEGRAVVRQVYEVPPTLHQGEGGAAICGLSLQTSSAGDDARWLNLVHHLLNPATRSGASWSLQSWQVYSDSGYFNLSGKQPAHFDSLRGSFRQVSRGLDAAPWLGCQAVWPSDRGVEATFTFVKTYSGTWFGYQLAKSPDRPDAEAAPPRRVLRELYFRVFEHMQHDASLRWVAGYLEASVPWNQIAQFAWAERFAPSGEASLIDFNLLEGHCDDFQAEAPTGVRLARDDAPARDALLAHLERTRPLAWREALDLTREKLDFEAIRWLWQSAGFERDRGLVAAYEGERPVAVALVETGETGASLFSLLDSVRLFDLTEGEGIGQACFGALLAAAAGGYRQRGKDRFVFYRESWPQEAALAAGLRDLGHGKFWAISRTLLPDFLEHVAALLPPKRSRVATAVPPAR